MDQMKSERYMRVMTQLDVEFEPDTEISKLLIIEKTQLDKEKEKETLHTKRIKDLESKKNKKDDDEE